MLVPLWATLSPAGIAIEKGRKNLGEEVEREGRSRERC